ncbi:MAG: 50S ribosomal protein L15 [Candidatus Omnitrophota bacterium]|nr:MAG: 50S ribosomal protein L15 [Candidatus Omnitrophota bacterium]
MLKLNDLKSPKGAYKKKKILGRGSGSGKGKTASRGHNGQLSRTGKGKRPGFEGGQIALIRRLPKRGFTSKFKKQYQIVNIQDLENRCVDKQMISAEELISLGLIRKLNIPVKVLGYGKLTKSLTVKASKFSKKAISAIEQSGGKVEVVNAQNS